jgi:hypothetical protein
LSAASTCAIPGATTLHTPVTRSANPWIAVTDRVRLARGSTPGATAAHLPRQATTVPVRGRGRAHGRPWLRACVCARGRLVYIEDQYLWSDSVARTLAEALRHAPGLQVIVVVPRFPDQDGPVSGPPNRLGQLLAMELLSEAGGDRFAIYDIETRPEPRSTSTRGMHHRRHVDDLRFGQLQPSLLDA